MDLADYKPDLAFRLFEHWGTWDMHRKKMTVYRRIKCFEIFKCPCQIKLKTLTALNKDN